MSIILEMTNYLQVVQFLKCFQGEATQNTDPSMMIHKPPEVWASFYTFTTMTQVDGDDYYYAELNIVILTSEKTGLLLDDTAASITWSPIGDFSELVGPS